MLPSDQCLETDQLPRLEIQDRLVVETELFSSEGVPHICFDTKLLASLDMHVLVKDLILRFTHPFGAVHRNICITKHVVSVGTRFAQGNTHTGAYEHLA